jgi:hypothetical protein
MALALNRRAHAYVALPVILSVVLVALCLPITCAMASPMNGVCANEPMRPMGNAHGDMPLHHSNNSPESCKHKDVPAQAVTSSQQVVVDLVAAPALAVEPAAVLPATPVAQVALFGASPPTSVLLTASQLRV